MFIAGGTKKGVCPFFLVCMPCAAHTADVMNPQGVPFALRESADRAKSQPDVYAERLEKPE